jgi:ATP-binding cassette subfamily F protein uup
VVLGLDGQGEAERFADYSQWDLWQAERKQPKPKPAPIPEAEPPARKKKLSYLDTREYENIETRIAQAEQSLEAARAALEDPAVMQDGRLLEQTYHQMQEAQGTIDQLYARWAELEAKIN